MNNIISFNECKFTSEDIVLLDTSVLLCFLGFDTYSMKNDGQKRYTVYKECVNLIKNITQTDACFTLSVQSIAEFNDVILRDMFKTFGVSTESDRKKLRETNFNKYSNTIGQAQNEVKSYLNNLSKQPAFYNEFIGCIDQRLINRAFEIQASYNLHGTGDAMQLAIAEQQEVTHFATLDCDFKSVNNNLTILVDDYTYNKYK